MVEQENSHSATVWWNNGTVTVEQSWWNSVVDSGTVMVEQCGGTAEQLWSNSVVEKWNSHSGTVWWNSRTFMVEQCGGTVEH